MSNSKTDIIKYLYKKLPNKQLTGYRNIPFGTKIRYIEGIPGDHGPYVKDEYAEFIIYMINNFEEIMGEL